MVQPVKRRQANVQRVQQLLAGISYIRSQKQISNLDRLAKYMERDHEVKKTEVERQLHYSVLDNLILSYTGVGFKGSKTGVEYEGFRIPDPGEVEPDDDGHDWYCFECHLPGEMYACSDCWRVFHADCQDEDTEDINYMCAVCKSARKKKKTKRKLLNTLLSYTIVRLKEKTRELHRIGHREEEKKYMPLFVYKAMDLNKMEQKVMAHKYKCIEEFLADAHNILHNMVLIYGDEVGGMTELAKIMIRDCKYDIDEMAQCQNCYYMSNAKPRDWFAQPCDPPHELVYAKLKGYSYWPAKVIHYVNSERYDVRFFGGLHQRAVIPKDQIKPIDTDLKKLNIKKTGGFVKAVEELGIHKEMLQERKDAEVVADDDDEDEEEISHQETQKEKRRKSKASVDDTDLDEDRPYKTKKEKKRKHKDDIDEVPYEKEKKRKKKDDGFDFDDNVETVSSSSFSSSKRSKSKKVSSPDDIVTSTEEYPPPNKKSRLSTSSTASQTSKKHTTASTTVSSTQTEDQSSVTSEQSTVQTEGKTETTPTPPQTKSDDPPVLQSSTEPKTCNCDVKCNKQLSETVEKLDREHKEDKQKALDELSERLHKDFEEDKQQAVSRAMSKLQTELDRVRRQTEDKCKEQYKDEMKKLAQKHKETISATKKKQWCYNCEEEAMYHCCWNTSYCSVKCQQEHWHKEHKRVCRRKR
ncbi:zinc finger MYND domain-containing protein 11-like isoform X2 [Mercenaria mercenaria]|uniref:zinc finger MYND domain-containing protein 11-like isoform X2 n=1 Tax=Mercenaria mercenaria TaxID=6596 RepID=UPI00234E409A|nr:zinc finger MYND domain-containing protein 11-like isoform X2 [Mercenaria mercenaria]